MEKEKIENVEKWKKLKSISASSDCEKICPLSVICSSFNYCLIEMVIIHIEEDYLRRHK